MTPKDIYIVGRGEYLTDHEGYSLTEACKIAEKEWDKSKEGERNFKVKTEANK